MAMITIYTLISVLIVSLVSFVGVLSLALSKKKLNKILLSLVSLSAGTLLGGAFLHLLPETVETQGFSLSVSLLVLAGVLTFFVLDKIIRFHRCEMPHLHTHSVIHEDHPHHLGIMNLAGDGIHNLLDGLIIAGSYLVSIPIGIATTIAVIFHEIPQELADFGVLLYAGFSKVKALLFNFFSAMAAIIGAIIGLILGAQSELFINIIIPFAVGNFLYIAGSNLIPELHKECNIKDSFWHLFALLLGIGIMLLLKFV